MPSADSSNNTRPRVAGIFLLIVSLPLLLTCGGEGGNGTGPEGVHVATVEVSPPSAELEPGETVQLTATPKASGGETLQNRSILWSSSDESVATVDGLGLVTAVGEGTVTITATVGDVNGTATITVTLVFVLYVYVSPTSTALTPGQTQQFTLMVWDGAGNVVTDRTVTWTSSNEGVATVDANGLATAVGEGMATVTGTMEGWRATATVTVLPPLIVTTSSLPDGAWGNASTYTETLAATGGAKPYRWSISAGTLPAGIAINSSTGVISGMPTALGTSRFTVMVTDANSWSDTQNLSINVTDGTYICSSQSEIPAAECQVLVALYLSTNGPEWTLSTDWLSTTTPCSWYGVTCTGGFVTGLDLYDNQLAGPIPGELANLATLQVLDLGRNELTGSIPPELGNLTTLWYLGLFRSDLTGPIPAELGNLAALHFLDLGGNELTGSIPAELGNLSNLQWLYLGSNRLTGTIPAELGNTNLRVLSLRNNPLTGTIPAELGKLGILQELWLYGTDLTGSIPPELGNLSELRWLYLQANQLTGPIPAEIGKLARLKRLLLDRNQLTGSIPAELGNLADLTELYLARNQLTGSIPAEIGSLANLKYLRLEYNQLTGSIPAELGNLANLTYLRLTHNQLTGLVPLPVAQRGGLIQAGRRENCNFGNPGLSMPDTPAYRAADLDGDGYICWVTIGADQPMPVPAPTYPPQDRRWH